MFCGKCGSPIKEGNSFCSICGAPIDGPATQINGLAQNPAQPISQPVQTVPIYNSAPQSGPVIQKNSFATAGLVLGIISACCSWAPLASYGMDPVSLMGATSTLIILSLSGILFSAFGIAKSRNGVGKGKAITGLILSIISTFFCLIAFSVIFAT